MYFVHSCLRFISVEVDSPHWYHIWPHGIMSCYTCVSCDLFCLGLLGLHREATACATECHNWRLLSLIIMTFFWGLGRPWTGPTEINRRIIMLRARRLFFIFGCCTWAIICDVVVSFSVIWLLHNPSYYRSNKRPIEQTNFLSDIESIKQ